MRLSNHPTTFAARACVPSCLRAFVPCQVLLFALLSPIAFAADTPSSPTTKPAVPLPAPDADGFISLFNGKDLDLWEAQPNYWSVKDGNIDCTQTRERNTQADLILTDSKLHPEKYTDFEIRLKYKWLSTTGNSGLQFRSKVVNAANSQLGGYQADFDPSRGYDGTIYDEQGVVGRRNTMANRGVKTTWSATKQRTTEPLKETADALKALIHAPNGEFNEVVLVVKGNHFTYSINGHVMSELIDDSPDAMKSGVIGLQQHAGNAMEIQFKDVKVKFLKEKE